MNGSSAEYISDYPSRSNGANFFKINSTDRRISFSIKPTSNMDSDKYLVLSYIIVDNTINVVISIEDILTSFIPPNDDCGSNIGPVSCQSTPMNFAGFSQSTTCDASNTPPPLPDDFDLNSELKHIEEVVAEMVQAGASPEELEAIKLSFLTFTFANGTKYDFKSIGGWTQDKEDAGNFFYGAVAGAIDISESLAIKAGGVAQQISDYNNPQSPSYNSLYSLVINLAEAYFSPTGNEDPADIPAVQGGRKYYTDVYKNDPNSENVKNSCDQSSDSGSTNTSTSGGGGTGWSSGFTYLGSGCIGSCSTPNITIIDLPDQEEEEVNDN